MKKKIFVRYNGGTESYFSCSDPTVLRTDKVYEIVGARDRGWQTDLSLKGISGEFNSVWFYEVPENGGTYMAISHEVPTVGKKLYCSRLLANGEKQDIITSTSSQVENLGDNLYKVITRNSIYYVLYISP